MASAEISKRWRVRLVGAALALALAACAGAVPIEYHAIDEIPEGPGAFTGEDGEWVIYGD